MTVEQFESLWLLVYLGLCCVLVALGLIAGGQR